MGAIRAALRCVAVPADHRRGRGRHRPLDPAGGERPPVRQAVAWPMVALARSARRQASFALTPRSPALATAGRVLGIIGICMATAALVALGVYGLLEYVGSRD